MDNGSEIYLLAWVAIGGGVGALIGSSKGKGGTGFVLGLLLGFIGWIIIAVLPRSADKEAEFQRQVAFAGDRSTAPSVPGQWAPDPYGRFDHRYFDGRDWTSHVTRDGQSLSDPVGFPPPVRTDLPPPPPVR